jgi:phosphatidylserine/phosphatidylglycerophosphate/cardiolipin synthase-like enzyme
MPPQAPDPSARGGLAVQLLRTYPVRHPGYPFARQGERSIARGYVKSLARASSLVYVEDQYLWSSEVASVYADALRREPGLMMLFVIPGYPEEDGRLSGPPNLLGREKALRVLQAAGGDRLAVYFLENTAGTPVYVHAKVCIVDDHWACIGSDNTNRRSWTHDTELSAAIVDESPRGWIRSLRLTLAEEHLGPYAAGQDLVHPAGFFEAFRAAADGLESWHRGGRHGPRPPGHVRPFTQRTVDPRTRLWAEPVYRVVFDPDGRRRRTRRALRF